MYFVEGYNGIRQMLYIFPLLVCVITDALLSSRLFEKKLATMALVILFFVVYIGFGVKMMRIFRNDLMHADEYAVECNKFLDSLGVAKTNFFISPHTIGLDYVNSHYPIKWSFIPNNEATLKLLSEKYSIDVLIIPPGHPLTVDIKEIKVKDSLLDGAFRLKEIRTFENSKYLIYRPVRGSTEEKIEF